MIYNYTTLAGAARLTSVLNADNSTIFYTYDSNSGKLINVKDSNGTIIESFTYGNVGNDIKVLSVTHSTGNTESYYYNMFWGFIRASSEGRVTVTYFDPSLALIREIDAEGGITFIEYDMDADGKNKYNEQRTMTGREGNSTCFNRDKNGNITDILNSDGSIKKFTYDNKNNITSVKDEEGKMTFYVYDSNSINLVKTARPLNGTDVYSASAPQNNFAITENTYYTSSEALTLFGKAIYGLIKTTKDPNGNTTTFSYDSNGHLVSVKDALNRTTLYQNNPIGWLKQETSVSGDITQYYYDKMGNIAKKVLHGGETEREVYNNRGLITQKIMPNQYAASSDPATFDANNIITNTNTYSNTDHGYRYTYLPNGLLQNVISPLGFGTTYTYDIYGNVLTEKLHNELIYVNTYDVLNRLSSVSFKETPTADAKLTDTYSYNIKTDGRSEVVHTKHLNETEAAVIKETYDFAGRLIRIDNPDGGYSINEYFKNGTLKESTDPNSNTTHYHYNGLNRLIGLWAPVGKGYMYTGYEFDKAGNVTKEIRSKDNVAALTIPQSNLIWDALSYDALGRVLTKTDSFGGKTSYEYSDTLNTVIQKVYTSTTAHNQTMKKYNYLGRLKESIRFVDSNDFIFSTAELKDIYTFDKEGNVLTHTNASGIVTTNTYDLLGRMLTSSQPGANENNIASTLTNVFTYDFMGNLLTSKDALERVTGFRYDKRGNLAEKTDAMGGVSVYSYDRANRLIKEVTPENHIQNADIDNMSRTEYEYYPTGKLKYRKEVYKEAGVFRTITNFFAYDLNGNILTQTDGMGYVTSFSYDPAGRLETMLDPAAADKNLPFTKKFSYNGLGQKTFELDANNVITSFTYNDQGYLTGTTVGGKLIGSRSYDLAGNMLTATDGNGNTTTYHYNSIGQVRQAVFPGDAAIGAYSISYKYKNTGDIARSETPLGKVNVYEYNEQRRLISETEMKSINTPNEEIIKSYKYDLVGNLRFFTDGEENKTEYIYDDLNRKKEEKKTVTVNGLPTVQTTVMGYDKNGNLKSVKDFLENTYSNEYDPLNRLVERKDPYGTRIEKLVYNDNHWQTASLDYYNSTTTFDYDKAGRLTLTTDASSKTKGRSYDGAGNLKTETDGRNNVTTYFYDPQNRLEKVTNALLEDTVYSYDDAGNLLTQTDGEGNTITYFYNVRNLVTIRVDAGGITNNIIDGSKAEYYSYYPDGALSEKTDRNGIEHSYGYDIHGRLISDNAGGEIISCSYDKNGNLRFMTDSTGITERTYDELGRVTSKDVPYIGTTTYSYDITAGLSPGFRSEVTVDPQMNKTTKVYDKAGRLKEVKDGNTVTAAYFYYENGNRQKVEYQGGASSEYTYYANNQLMSLANKRGSLTIEAFSYSYDAGGNMSSKVDRKGTTNYSYDNLNRLLCVSEPGNKLTGYTFDAAGNRLTETVTESVAIIVTSYSYNMQNRLIATTEKVNGSLSGGTDYFYDNNGNMISSSGYTLKPENNSVNAEIGLSLMGVNTSGDATLYEYDKRNNLIKVVQGETTTVSKYNGDGLRVEKSISGQVLRYLYEYDKVILEVNASGAQTARNVYGMNLLKRTAGSDSYQYMYNGHGDVTALLNASGTVVVQYYYSAFGVITEETHYGAKVNNSIKYAGYQHDEESDLYYLNARHYDPTIARFMQEDTYRGSLRDPLSLNLYTYCNNEPLMYYDPTGHSGTTVTVTLPNGTKTTGTITNGITTLANGQRPPAGSTVHAANGKDYYVVSDSSGVGGVSGVQVDTRGTATVTTTNSNGKTTSTTGTIINGQTYIDGNRVSAGSIVTLSSGTQYVAVSDGSGGITGVKVDAALLMALGITGKDSNSLNSSFDLANMVAFLSNDVSRSGYSRTLPGNPVGETYLSFLNLRIYDEAVTKYKDDPVKQAQYMLKHMGFDIGEVDGNLGVKSKTALMTIQWVSNISITGEADAKTLEKISLMTLYGANRQQVMEASWAKEPVISADGKSIIINGLTLERNPDNNLVQLPKSGTGYTTYGSRLWGTPDVITSIFKVADSWNSKYPSVLLQIGNLSNREGGNAGMHYSHIGGLSVDMRPVRNDDKVVGGNSWEYSTYSQSRTNYLMQMWVSNTNVSHIYFNDPVLVNRYDNVKSLAAHDDHLHIQFLK